MVVLTKTDDEGKTRHKCQYVILSLNISEIDIAICKRSTPSLPAKGDMLAVTVEQANPMTAIAFLILGSYCNALPAKLDKPLIMTDLNHQKFF